MSTVIAAGQNLTKMAKTKIKLFKKLESIPAIAVFAFAGLLLGMCIYFGPLETYAPITAWYHARIPNDYWRHLLVRAYPETTFAAWFAQCVAVVAVVGGTLRKYRVFKLHELFWRPVVGLLFTIPGAAAMAGILWLWNRYGLGSRIHSAAHAFCSAGSSGHCLSHHLVTVISSHPGVLGQIEQATVLDGQKKLIVIAGSFVFGLWWMMSYFLNVQGWLAEHSVISTNAKNASRVEKGKQPLYYVHAYHRFIPGFRDRILFLTESGSDLHLENHRTINNVVYKTFRAVVVAGILGGLYIMLFISQGQYLHLSVVH